MKKFMFVMYIVCLSVILTPTAYAYIDPATTSYIIQICAGVFIALGTVCGIYWKKIKSFFSKKKSPEKAVPEMKKPESVNDENSVVTADDLLDD